MIPKLEFELACYNTIDQLVSHYATGTYPILIDSSENAVEMFCH